MIIVQMTSALGAWLFGIIGEKTGFKKTLIASILLMIAAVIWMIFAQNLTAFFIIGALAGFALTGVQSLSRTMTSLFAPESKATEFFNFFAVAGKSSSFLGPTIFGLLSAGVATRMEVQGMEVTLAEQYGTRAGTVTIAIFLVIGLVILLFVNEKRARQAAEEYVPTVE
jgi:UMF1 family MFS transporter